MNSDQATVEQTAPVERRKQLVPLLVGGVVVLAALCIALGLLLERSLDTSASDVSEFLEQRGEVVESRSSRLAQLLLNYDATNIDNVADSVLEMSTGNFRQQYERLLPDLGPALERVGASSRGRILEGPFISFRSPTEAVAIIKVTQTTQSRNNPTGKTIDYIWQVVFVDISEEGWKADRLEILSQIDLSF